MKKKALFLILCGLIVGLFASCNRLVPDSFFPLLPSADSDGDEKSTSDDSVVTVTAATEAPIELGGSSNNSTTEPLITTTKTTASPVATTDDTTTASPVTTTENTTTASPVTTTENTTTASPVTTTDDTTTASSVVTTENTTTKPPVITTQATTTKPPVTTTQATTTKPPVITTQATTTKPPVTTTQATTTKPPVTTTQATTTTPVVITPSVPSVGSTSSSVSSSDQQRMLGLVNGLRADLGLAPLKLCDDAVLIAQIRAEECAEYYSHTRPDGSAFYTIYHEMDISYSLVGENIGRGTLLGADPVSTFFNLWKNSTAHYENMVSERIEYFGYGCYQVGGETYVAQAFIDYMN